MKIRMEKYEIEENVKSLIYPRKEGSDSKYLEYDKVVFLLLFLFFFFRIWQSFKKHFRYPQRT